MQEFITIPEVIKRLRTSKATIYEAIRLGKLRAVRIGARKMVVRSTDFDKFIGTQSTGPAVLTA